MKLELYSFETCPFCRKVFRFLETRPDLKIEIKDIHKNPEYREELARINNGITQVPCLVIDGKPMLESDDIIEFLKGLS
ncbi:MAG: glutaredoxin [Planctomycetota bacterium]|nr:MAG: glutaredoxin [Planctomycetota bacterium]